MMTTQPEKSKLSSSLPIAQLYSWPSGISIVVHCVKCCGVKSHMGQHYVCQKIIILSLGFICVH